MRASGQRCRQGPGRDDGWMGRASTATAPARRRMQGNQAALRQAHARCAECEDEAHLARTAPMRRQTAPAPAAAVSAAPPPVPTSEDVWGLTVTRAMCGCRDRIRRNIAWANTAAATYAACDVPANPTSNEVENCFDAAHPTAVVVASTSSSGVVTMPPASSNPCDRIDIKATFVHEEMHRRSTEAIARKRGAAFYAEWQRLAGASDRIDQLRVRFPAETAAHLAEFHNGHEWAIDEVNSYRWERRFYEDALAALNRIC